MDLTVRINDRTWRELKRDVAEAKQMVERNHERVQKRLDEHGGGHVRDQENREPARLVEA